MTHREFIWTLAKTRYEINDAVTLHNEALTVFICLMFALVKSLVRVQKLRCNDKIFHAVQKAPLLLTNRTLQRHHRSRAKKEKQVHRADAMNVCCSKMTPLYRTFVGSI